MNPTRRIVTAQLVALGALAFGGAAMAAPKAAHHDGKKLLGDKVKTHGNHVIDKKGPHTVSVEVKDGKVAGLHVKHNKKGELPVKKYKTSKKMARAEGMQYVGYQLAQAQSLGTVYIGYAYVDDYGYEEIYWFPYEMIYDGDTGAVEYVPVY
jgi:hypothetical protein